MNKVLIKLAQVRLAINHVLRSRMAKQGASLSELPSFEETQEQNNFRANNVDYSRGYAQTFNKPLNIEPSHHSVSPYKGTRILLESGVNPNGVWTTFPPTKKDLSKQREFDQQKIYGVNFLTPRTVSDPKVNGWLYPSFNEFKQAFTKTPSRALHKLLFGVVPYDRRTLERGNSGAYTVLSRKMHTDLAKKNTDAIEAVRNYYRTQASKKMLNIAGVPDAPSFPRNSYTPLESLNRRSNSNPTAFPMRIAWPTKDFNNNYLLNENGNVVTSQAAYDVSGLTDNQLQYLKGIRQRAEDEANTVVAPLIAEIDQDRFDSDVGEGRYKSLDDKVQRSYEDENYLRKGYNNVVHSRVNNSPIGKAYKYLPNKYTFWPYAVSHALPSLWEENRLE